VTVTDLVSRAPTSGNRSINGVIGIDPRRAENNHTKGRETTPQLGVMVIVADFPADSSDTPIDFAGQIAQNRLTYGG
jgi:hypothetical protein